MAGEGFEPSTSSLWGWRATELLYPASRICAIRTPPQHPKCRVLPLHHILYKTPPAGFEPATSALTVQRSTTGLQRNSRRVHYSPKIASINAIMSTLIPTGTPLASSSTLEFSSIFSIKSSSLSSNNLNSIS